MSRSLMQQASPTAITFKETACSSAGHDLLRDISRHRNARLLTCSHLSTSQLAALHVASVMQQQDALLCELSSVRCTCGPQSRPLGSDRCTPP